MRRRKSSKNNGLFKAAALLLLLLGAHYLSAQYWEQAGKPNRYGTDELYYDTVNDEFFAFGEVRLVDSNGVPYAAHSVYKLNKSNQVWDTIDKRNIPFFGNLTDMIWYKGRYYLTGSFHEVGSANEGNWVYYEGGKWNVLDPKPKGSGSHFFIDQDTLYMAGSFEFTSNLFSPGFVKFDGMDYYPIKPLLDTAPNSSTKPWVWDVIRFNDMIIVAGNMFENLPVEILYPLMIYQNGTKRKPEGYDMSMYSKVFDLAVYQDALYVGGTFRKSDGVSFANHIVMWNGENWYELGNGCDGEVHGMIEYHGDLIVTGIFNHCDGVYSPYIIKWNGKRWCSFTNDQFNNRITDLEVYDDTLYIAGWFTQLGKNKLRSLAKWAGGDSVIECGPVHYIGVQQPEGQDEIKLEVRPNPTDGVLQVQSVSKMTRLELRNLQGQMLYEKQLNSVHDHTLDLSGLNPSIYVLRVVTEEGTTVRKVVKR